MAYADDPVQADLRHHIAMQKLLPLLALALLSACGMKGDLVLPNAADAKPDGEAAPAVETPEEEAAKRQGVDPPSADPDVVTP